MKKIVNLLSLFLVLLLCTGFTSARPFENPIKNAIKKADISNSALISVSFKDISNCKSEFEMNATTPMSPASVQKLVTIFPSLNALGDDYEFKTQLYNNKDSHLYLKLGADPTLTSKDLRELIRNLESKKIYSTKAFYIDDSVLDSTEWGEGWQWDNDLNPLMPRFGAYNLDKNLITVTISPTQLGAPAEISTNVFYPTAFVNNIITGEQNNIRMERKNYISPDVINAEGTVSKEFDMQIPVNYPRRYFILRLEENLRKQKFSYYGDFNRLKLPKNTSLIAEIKHPIAPMLDDLLKNSNNMLAETIFKVAGGKYTNSTGSIDRSIEMFNEYYAKEGIKTDNIKIVDGSGVSKNNLLTADFITNVLAKESKKDNFNCIKSHIAAPGEGTLKDRMLYFKDNLRAKTGTLTNVSAIAGYLKVKSGKTYAFCIMINDPKSKSADKKAFEEYVLRQAFDSL